MINHKQKLSVFLIFSVLLFTCIILDVDSVYAGWRRPDSDTDNQYTEPNDTDETQDETDEKDQETDIESSDDTTKKLVQGSIIGGISLVGAKVLNDQDRKRRNRKQIVIIDADHLPKDKIMIAGDLDAYSPEIKAEILKRIQSDIDKLKNDGYFDIHKKKLDEFNKLKKNPYFNDAIQMLRNEGYKTKDIAPWEIEETIERITTANKNLKDRKICRQCRKPVKAIHLNTPEDRSVGKWYTHTTPSGSRHKWFTSHKRDKTAYDNWRESHGLPTIWTHCKCAYCGTLHRRDNLKLNSWIQRTFGMGPKFQCKNPKCKNWQWVPKTKSWQDDIVRTFR